MTPVLPEPLAVVSGGHRVCHPTTNVQYLGVNLTAERICAAADFRRTPSPSVR
jgi:hypothetical protein